MSRINYDAMSKTELKQYFSINEATHMDSQSKDEVLNQLSEFIELRQPNLEEDTVFVKLIDNDDFLKRFYV